MVTIKDIAREAGVSHGTVSNVLNKTGKVSSKKIALVEEACRKLGYKANAQAQNLKMGRSRNIAVVLPSIALKHLLTFFETLQAELFARGYGVQLYLTDDLESVERSCIEKIYENRSSLIVTCSCLKQALPYEGDTPVVCVDRALPGRAPNMHDAGFSLYDAGRDIGRYIQSKGYGRVALFSSPIELSDFTQFKLGLADTLAGDIDYYRSDFKLIMGKAMQLASEAGQYDVIVTTDYNRAEALKTANYYCKTSPFPEIVAMTDNALFEDRDFTLYRLDYGKLGRQVAEEVDQYCKHGVPLEDIRLPNTGFLGKPKFTKMQAHLAILTLESPATDALLRLLPQFKEETGISVAIDALPYDELYQVVLNPERCRRYDLIRVDMAWLPQIAESTFRPLDTEEPAYKQIVRHFIPELGDDYSRVGESVYAFPFDPSVQILFYNRDAFGGSRTQRLFFEKTRTKLSIPQDWEMFDKVARFFTLRLNPDSPVSYGTATTCGTPGVAACDFLPRLNGKNGSMEQLLRAPETVKALGGYVEAFGYTDQTVKMWWKESIDEFSEGKLAMLVSFMNHASKITNSKHSRIVGKVGFAQVPGGHPLLGGGSIGIGRYCRNLEAATQFLRWVYSDEISQLYTFFGGISPNACVYENPEILNIYPWLSIARDGFKAGKRRFVSADDAANQKALESILGGVVRTAVIRHLSPEEALAEVVQRRGVEAQARTPLT